MDNKECRDCKEVLPREQFAKNKARKDGLDIRCRECRRKFRLEKGAADYMKKLGLKRNHGITIEEYNSMLEAQDHRCLIDTNYENKPGGNHGPLVVDHCHLCGEIRGLLNHLMNWGLGVFKDNPTLLRAAADYLERHKC